MRISRRWILIPRSVPSGHEYVLVLIIEHKNVITWTNLGLLYFRHSDLELANEALYRAQTLDPDYTVAWLGQALVATANGHDVEARAIFEHAVGLAADVVSFRCNSQNNWAATN
jgi:superkiller protein 3